MQQSVGNWCNWTAIHAQQICAIYCAAWRKQMYFRRILSWRCLVCWLVARGVGANAFIFVTIARTCTNVQRGAWLVVVLVSKRCCIFLSQTSHGMSIAFGSVPHFAVGWGIVTSCCAPRICLLHTFIISPVFAPPRNHSFCILCGPHHSNIIYTYTFFILC